MGGGGGRDMPYAIREPWLSMNIIPFRTVFEWSSTLTNIYEQCVPRTCIPHIFTVYTNTFSLRVDGAKSSLRIQLPQK